MAESPIRKFDLIIIGSGLAGTAAACFAQARGLKTMQVSATMGEMGFASGLLDLLGIYPLHEQIRWENPWAGIASLIADSPRHPYAVLGIGSIREANHEFLSFLDTAGLHYCGLPDRNVTLVTAAGTLKMTYRVPQSMWHGVIALQEKLPTLIIDFPGMKDFSAGLIVQMLHSGWPALQARRIEFPQRFLGIDLQNLLLAEAMESSEVRAKLADIIRPYLDGVHMLAMPALLGLRSVSQVTADLEERLGVGIFEIPTLPPSVSGLRLREALEVALQRKGLQFLQGRCVIGARTKGRRCIDITTGSAEWQETFEAEGFILATGRFLGGGLTSRRNGIHEALFGLPVAQPSSRELWHRGRFLDHRGHPVNRAGLEIDDQFRPLGTDRVFAFENLFAAGSVLAHQDWVRTKSGAGLAIATAYGAVESFLRSR